jgi:hypothetical protein
MYADFFPAQQIQPIWCNYSLTSEMQLTTKVRDILRLGSPVANIPIIITANLECQLLQKLLVVK